MDLVGTVNAYLLAKKLSVPHDWLIACINWIKEENNGHIRDQKWINDQVYEQLLHADLTELATCCLPFQLNSLHSTVIRGNFLLQTNKVLDIGQPAYSQLQKIRKDDVANALVNCDQPKQASWEPKGGRMLMMELTDGTSIVKGIEYKPIPALKIGMNPGIKILVSGAVMVRRGILLLTSDLVNILGGEVDTLRIKNAPQNVLARALNLEETTDPVNVDEAVLQQELEQTGQSTYTNAPFTASLASLKTNMCQPNCVSFSKKAKVNHYSSQRLTHSQGFRMPLNQDEFPDEDLTDGDIDDTDFLAVNMPVDDIPDDMFASIDIPEENVISNAENDLDNCINVSDDTEVDEMDLIMSQCDIPFDASVMSVSSKPQLPVQSKNEMLTMHCALPQGYSSPQLHSSHPSVSELHRSSSSIGVGGQEECSRVSSLQEKPKSLPMKSTLKSTSRADSKRFHDTETASTSATINTDDCTSMSKPEVKSRFSMSPFTYLCFLPESPQCDIESFCVKGFVITLMTRLTTNKDRYHLVAKINDGSGSCDVKIHSKILESFTGVSAVSMADKMVLARTDRTLKHSVQKSISKCQQELIRLCGVLHLEWKVGCTHPVLTQITHVTPEGAACLKNR